MRTIKFRAQDIASNKWLYGDIRHHKNDVCIFEQGGHKGEQVKPETVGQFTGLVDKNGREIYEGDFINYDGSTWGGVVQWHPNGYFFINDSYEKKCPRCDSYRSLGDMLDGRPLVVIGNIHDNPDLIEKGGDECE
jgi:uncharacterized phage protein (TIGR01671 family)